MKASVIIVTKNRCAELRRALRSCLMQSELHEVLVVDDGSTDGSSDMVRSEFPNVILTRHEASAGCIVRRNEAFYRASGDVILSIDDDAEFSTPRVVSQTLLDFDDIRIAVVAIPLVEPNQHNRRLQFAPNHTEFWICDSFKGTAFAVRREVFLAIGGFRSDLVHQGEETDLSIRLLAEGLVVRVGRADPIVHHESSKRDMRRTDFFGRRNDVLFAFRNVPAGPLLLHLLGTTVNGLKATAKTSNPQHMLNGLLVGWIDGFRLMSTRRPVNQRTYRCYRRLRAVGTMRFTDL